MSKSNYWAVWPKSVKRELCRIEKAASPFEAIRLAFGSRLMERFDRGRWSVKSLGSNVRLLQSDKKRIAALSSDEGWIDPFDWKE
jgi:hypothetical protein